jgi:hypothetical protein
MDYEFYLGIDTDPKAGELRLSVVEKSSPGGTKESFYHTRHLQTIRDTGEVREAAERVRSLLADRPFASRTMVVVNETEKRGRMLARELADQGLTPVGVHLTSSDDQTQLANSLSRQAVEGAPREGTGGFIVSERRIVENLLDLHHGGYFKIEQPDGIDSSGLLDQLQAAAQAADETGSPVAPSSNGDGASTEYLLAAGLATWFGEQRSFDATEGLGGETPTTGPAKREHRPDTT